MKASLSEYLNTRRLGWPYEISPERYAVQIYRHMGFEVEGRDEDMIRFIWRR